MEDKTKINESRRDALKKTLLLVGGIFTPSLLTFSQRLSGMDIGERDIFFIRRVVEALQGNMTSAPEKPFSASYQHDYNIFFITEKGEPLKKGHITIKRYESGPYPKLDIRITRDGTQGYSQYVKISQEIVSGSAISAPAEWTYDLRFSSSETGLPLYGIPLAGKGFGKKEKIIINESAHRNTYLMQNKQFTLAWNLMDAVQYRGFAASPLHFDIIDECDMYGGKATIQIFKPAEIEINKTTYKLNSFMLTGTGTLPKLYWVTETGRLLFVNAGMEVYILNSAVSI